MMPHSLFEIPEDQPSYKVISARGMVDLTSKNFAIHFVCQRRLARNPDTTAGIVPLYVIFESKTSAQQLLEHCFSSTD